MKNLKDSDIEALCSKRLILIEQLQIGKLTKEDFIIENYKMLQDYGKVTYDIKSIEEGVLKYHYFNTMAKKLMLEADAIEFRSPGQYLQLKNQAFDYYVKKDKITLSMIEYAKYEDVKAYYINMQSKSLEGAIFEINFETHEKVILHSKDRKILYKLREAGCFLNERVDSIINSYVNTKVY